MGEDRRWWWIGACAAGALAGVSLPPLGAPWLLWPAIALLWALPRSPLGWRGALAWGGLAVLVSHRWLLWLHPLDWIGVPGPLSLPLCLLLWLLCGGAAALLVALWIAAVQRCERFWGAEPPARLPSLPTALLAAAAWGLGEQLLARGPLFWIGLGASALPADPLLAAWAQIGGAPLIAALQLLIGWLLLAGLRLPPRRRGQALLCVAAGVALLHLGGAALRARPLAPPLAASQVLVVQPAIPTREKFQLPQQLLLLQRLAAAQRFAAAARERGEMIEAVVLPEGALPLDQPLPEPAGVEVLSGGFRREDSGVRSSLLRFSPGDQAEASGWIDKNRLVPLGEWVPRLEFLNWSGLSAVGGLEPGPRSRLLRRPSEPVGVAICYEIADGAAQREAVRAGARWLLASANLDPYPLQLQRQFEALAQLRALENGRWLVSSANTGPSLVVDARGRRRASLPAGRPGTALLPLEFRQGLTPYGRWGDAPLFGLALAAAAWGTLRRSSLRGAQQR
jgi:apolipoprotein N-acyltransferase